MWNIQFDECPLHDIVLITTQTKINNCHHYHSLAAETPTENQFTQRVITQHYFVSLIGLFDGMYTR